MHPVFSNIEASIQVEIMDVELDVAYELWNSGHTTNPAVPTRYPRTCVLFDWQLIPQAHDLNSGKARMQSYHS